MKSYKNIDSILDENKITTAYSIIENSDCSFSDLANKLSLNKEKDFLHSDLKGVDFTGSDLRGYNFNGADLRDSYGSSIIFDETTNFENADIAPSIFSYKLKLEEFHYDESNTSEFERLKSLDWADIAIWAHGLETVSFEQSMMAKQLLLENISPTAKKDIAYNARKYFSNYKEIAEFLYFCISEDDLSQNIGFGNIITAIGEAYSNNNQVYEVLYNMRYFGDVEIQEKVINALLTSSYSSNQNRRIIFNEFNSKKGKKLRIHLAEMMVRSLPFQKKYIFSDLNKAVQNDIYSLDKEKTIKSAIKSIEYMNNFRSKNYIRIHDIIPLNQRTLRQYCKSLVQERDEVIYKYPITRNLMRVGLPRRAKIQDGIQRKEKERLERLASNSIITGRRVY